ncbi:hypothetical protein [Shewanella sp. NKUCC06_TVS]|uniref:hypothetical protein n=1 Tax=Shewanella sp. NKUCC06_TVS TaxID=2842128 RepID=UPI001C5B25F3|nr:hypothetical protein [Shewanella sp. NKUCC06_TVS]MBW3532988.1 hypothetical protein [Shewanella sp. NKUCC06_TVS]
MTTTTYLALQKFHIVPLNNLDPTSIKIAAKNTICDREDIKHNSKLNAIASRLGVSGGFANYEDFFNNKFVNFLNINGLKKRKNLLKHQFQGEYRLFQELTHQQVSERLFYSGRKIPTKIFTGHNFDFSSVFGLHAMDIGVILNQLTEFEFVKNSINLYSPYDLLDSIEHIEINAFKEITFEIYKQKITCLFIDIVILFFYRASFSSSFFHLISDVITDDENTDVVLLTYTPGNLSEEEKSKISNNMKNEVRLVQLFKKRLAISDTGWVNVKKLNDNLTIIYDCYGNYDYLIKNQRDKLFDHQVFGENLKRSQIPSFIEEYRFQRWHYFEYQGWRDLDNHLAEEFFYNKGKSIGDYPGQDVILQQLLISKGIYRPLKRAYSNELNGFHKVKIDGKKLMVSDLITIEDFMYFAAENGDYMSYRNGDNLLSVNSDDNRNLPSSVNFYDALSYINWKERLEKIPFRLLTLSEYKQLAGPKSNSYRNSVFESDLIFYKLDGTQYDTHPPYMSENDFQGLRLKFGYEPNIYTNNNLSFIDSDSFCEWLLEGCQIRSKSHLSFYFDKFIERSCGPKSSTGKYKGLKTGFRICYELN